MTEQTFESTTPRLGSIDRYSPAVLLPLALLFGLVAQLLFYGVGVGINLGIATVALLGVAWRGRPARARVDRFDLWVAPAAIPFAVLPPPRVGLMLPLFALPPPPRPATLAA